MKIFHTLFTCAVCALPMNSFSVETTTSSSLLETLKQRHSGYSYDASKTVSKEQLLKLIEAARTAPSSYNDQPWHFLITDRQETPAAYQKVLNSLVEFNQGWAKNAPILIVVAADSQFQKNGKENLWGGYDSGAAAFALMLEASDLGLMAHQMGGFDAKKIQTDLQIPSRFTPMSVMAVGYESAGEAVKPKERKPTKENFFMGSWGNGISE